MCLCCGMYVAISLAAEPASYWAGGWVDRGGYAAHCIVVCLWILWCVYTHIQLLVVCIEPFAVEPLATYNQYRVLAHIILFIAVSFCVIVCCSSVCWLFSCGVRGCEVGYCIIMMLLCVLSGQPEEVAHASQWRFRRSRAPYILYGVGVELEPALYSQKSQFTGSTLVSRTQITLQPRSTPAKWRRYSA